MYSRIYWRLNSFKHCLLQYFFFGGKQTNQLEKGFQFTNRDPFPSVNLTNIALPLKQKNEIQNTRYNFSRKRRAHKIISEATRNGVDAQVNYFERKAQAWESYIETNFDALRERMGLINDDVPKEDQKKNFLEFLLTIVTSPLANFSLYHLQHSGAAKALEKAGITDDLPILGDYLKRQEKIQERLRDIIKEEVDAVLNALKHPFHLKENIIGLIKPLIRQVLDITQGILTGLIEAMAGLFKKMQGMLDTKMKLPFFSTFYKFLGKLYGDVDEELENPTLLDLLSLMIAVPASVVFRIIKLGKKLSKQVPDNFTKKETFAAILDQGNPETLNFTKNVNSSSTRIALKTRDNEVSDWQIAAHSYSILGGIIGGASGLIASVLNMKTAKNTGPNQNWNKGNYILAAVICVMTIPLPSTNEMNGKQTAAYVLRWLQYLISTGFSLVVKWPKRWQGIDPIKQKSLGIGVQCTAFVLSPIADFLNWPGALSWLAHCGSRIGGTIDSVEKAQTVPDPDKIIAAAGFSMGGSALVLVNCILAIKKDVKILHHGTLT